MKSDYRLKLAIIMIVSVIVISFAIATVDYLRQKEYIKNANQNEVNLIEEIVVDSVKTIEKAYSLFDKDTTTKMNTHTERLLKLYDETPDLDQWDFQELKEDFGMDIYMIDDASVITHGSLDSDIGLDFSECCQSLERILEEKRMTGDFFEDGMDVEQETGTIKKYTYKATKDKKYLIQLGYTLENGDIFKEFNFLNVIEELIEEHGSIDNIRVLNMGGLSYGDAVDQLKLAGEKRKAFDHTYRTKKITELKLDSNIYRYVAYESPYETGTSKTKVIEIAYNENELQSILKRNQVIFYTQLTVVLIIIAIITFIIHKWVAKQVYFAYHDGLTRLKNRASFDETINKNVLKNSATVTALFMIDLDNFKLINDNLGHDRGDYVLKLVGSTIHNKVQEKGDSFRIGGDEFAVLLQDTSAKEAKKIAKQIVSSIEKSINDETDLRVFNVTASVGISLAPEHTVYPESLYKKADIALYDAKKKGKNQYQMYKEELLTHRENIVLP